MSIWSIWAYPGNYRVYKTGRTVGGDVTCLWTWYLHDEYFETSCDHAYCTEPDELEEGVFRYCPYCGMGIELQMPDDR